MAKTDVKFKVNQKAKDAAFSVFDALGISPNDAVNMFLLYTATHQKLPFRPEKIDKSNHSIEAAEEAISSIIDEKQENIKFVRNVIKKVEEQDVFGEKINTKLHLEEDGVDKASGLIASAKEDFDSLGQLAAKIKWKLSDVDKKAKVQMLTIEDVVENRIKEFHAAKKWIEDILQLHMSDPLRQQNSSFWNEFDRCEKMMREADSKLKHVKGAEKEIWAQDVIELLEIMETTKESFKKMKIKNSIK